MLGAAAQLCAGLLQECDDVRVLATSREPLTIAVRRSRRARTGPSRDATPARPARAVRRVLALLRPRTA
jgi:hypothetical protein